MDIPYGKTYRNMYEETEPFDNLSKLTFQNMTVLYIA